MIIIKLNVNLLCVLWRNFEWYHFLNKNADRNSKEALNGTLKIQKKDTLKY